MLSNLENVGDITPSVLFLFNGCVHEEANFIEVADILSRRAIGKTFLQIGPGKV